MKSGTSIRFYSNVLVYELPDHCPDSGSPPICRRLLQKLSPIIAGGRFAVNKAVFLLFDKLRVVSNVEPQFLYDLSDRRVEEQVNLHLACKWFAGLQLEEAGLDYSALCGFTPAWDALPR